MKESKCYLNTLKRAEEAGMEFGRLEVKKMVDGSLCSFYTKRKGEKRKYFWGYYYINQEIDACLKDMTVEEMLEQDKEEEPEVLEYELHGTEVYATI